MKLYKTSTPFDPTANQVSWQSSADTASKQRTAYKAEGVKKPISEAVEIPTNKEGLLAWLNENVKA
jgi:hypothetical protein